MENAHELFHETYAQDRKGVSSRGERERSVAFVRSARGSAQSRLRNTHPRAVFPYESELAVEFGELLGLHFAQPLLFVLQEVLPETRGARRSDQGFRGDFGVRARPSRARLSKRDTLTRRSVSRFGPFSKRRRCVLHAARERGPHHGLRSLKEPFGFAR